MTKALISNCVNRKKKSGSKKDLVFYFSLVAFPILQFIVFYIIVNINSIFLCFQEYDLYEGGISGFKFLSGENFFANFKAVFQLEKVRGVQVGLLFKNSFIIWAVSIFVGTFLAIFFSYYIYKKRTFCKIFKFFLFLPSVIPAILMTTIFKEFMMDFVSKIMANNGKEFITTWGLIDPYSKTAFPLIVAYSIWISFGSQVLFYTNAMAQIPPSLMEASEIDGCNHIRQLFHIVIPQILPTIETFLIASIAGFFMNQMNLFNIYGVIDNAPELGTIGYFIYSKAAPGAQDWYPVMSAFGICCSFIAIPAVFLLKQLTKRFTK